MRNKIKSNNLYPDKIRFFRKEHVVRYNYMPVTPKDQVYNAIFESSWQSGL